MNKKKMISQKAIFESNGWNAQSDYNQKSGGYFKNDKYPNYKLVLMNLEECGVEYQYIYTTNSNEEFGIPIELLGKANETNIQSEWEYSYSVA